MKKYKKYLAMILASMSIMTGTSFASELNNSVSTSIDSHDICLKSDEQSGRYQICVCGGKMLPQYSYGAWNPTGTTRECYSGNHGHKAGDWRYREKKQVCDVTIRPKCASCKRVGPATYKTETKWTCYRAG